jgi:hypothetical protein
MGGPITGGCLCGAVRFAFSEPPLVTRACWCRDCQYLSSGNASISAIFSTASFRLTGKTGAYVSRADSGTMMRRRFCRACGTPLFSEAEDRTDLMVVRAGALDDPAIARPSSAIWTASAPVWAKLDPELPGCAGQPRSIPEG